MVQQRYEAAEICPLPYDTRARETSSKFLFPDGVKVNPEQIVWVSGLDPDLSEADTREMLHAIFDQSDLLILADWIQRLADRGAGGQYSVKARLAFDSRDSCIKAASLLKQHNFQAGPNPDTQRIDRVVMNLGACLFVSAFAVCCASVCSSLI